jgi:hypothetical protein
MIGVVGSAALENAARSWILLHNLREQLSYARCAAASVSAEGGAVFADVILISACAMTTHSALSTISIACFTLFGFSGRQAALLAQLPAAGPRSDLAASIRSALRSASASPEASR